MGQEGIALLAQSDSKADMANGTKMTRLTSIVAIDQCGAIGCKNTLPWVLKSDLAFFKQQTIGNAVVMGRKTYDSIGKCLPGRENIVLSHNQVLFPETAECKVAGSIDEVFHQIFESKKKEIFVVGGSQTYLHFSDFVDRYLVTFVNHSVDGADAFLDKSIVENFKVWHRERIASFETVSERDQFPFEIFEITPPNPHERLEKRLAITERYRAHWSRSKPSRKTGSVALPNSQEAFAF